MNDKYILDGKTPVLCNNLLTWAKWFETAERTVAKTVLRESEGRGIDIKISTVFLGIDHNYHSEGEPILFETMVFGGPLDQQEERYTTWDKAEAGHKQWVDKIKSL